MQRQGIFHLLFFVIFFSIGAVPAPSFPWHATHFFVNSSAPFAASPAAIAGTLSAQRSTAKMNRIKTLMDMNSFLSSNAKAAFAAIIPGGAGAFACSWSFYISCCIWWGSPSDCGGLSGRPALDHAYSWAQ